jgi:LysM repeat protein
MNSEAQGSLALFIFILLLLFFLAAWAVAAESVQQEIVTSPNGVIIVNPVDDTPVLATPIIATPVVIEANPSSTDQLLIVPIDVVPAASGATANGDLIRYTVQSGEWLRLIAQRYNTTVDAILAVNPQITDPDVLSPGQEILIPAPGN